jgi:Tol biopolymer transport system component
MRQLTDDVHKDRGMAWSPDGERIAFYSTRSGKSEVWTIRPDGSELRQLAADPDVGIYNPVWSPDGSKLLYQDANHDTVLLDLSKSGAERAYHVLPLIGETEGRMWVDDWSPDGRELLGFGFLAEDMTHTGIFIYSIEKGEYREVNPEPLGPFPSPRYLNDGRRALLRSESILHLLDLETGELQEVDSKDLNVRVGHFALSPDDGTIYYTSGYTDSDIWMLTLE